MNDKIVLNRDINGNYRVDIVGLLYLIQDERLSEESVVFCLNTKKDYVLNQPLFGPGFLEDDKGKPLSLTAETLSSEYIIVMETPEEDEEDEEDYELIHFEEALMRISKGEVVYLEKDSHKEMIDQDSFLTASEISSNKWYTTNKIKGVKHPVKNPPRESFLNKRKPKDFNPWELFGDFEEEILDEEDEVMEIIKDILESLGFEIILEDITEDDWDEYY